MQVGEGCGVVGPRRQHPRHDMHGFIIHGMICVGSSSTALYAWVYHPRHDMRGFIIHGMICVVVIPSQPTRDPGQTPLSEVRTGSPLGEVVALHIIRYRVSLVALICRVPQN